MVEGKGEILEGKKDGLWEEYWDNGQLVYKGHYKDGKKDGLWEEYDEYGKRSRGNYKDGKKDGLWVSSYDENGKRS